MADRREHAFVTTYRFAIPQVEVQARRWVDLYARLPGADEEPSTYVTTTRYGLTMEDAEKTALVRLLRKLGAEIVHKGNGTEKETRDSPEAVERLRKMRERFEDLSPEEGHVGFNDSFGVGWVHIRTPSKLGQREHLARRRVVEDTLRGLGLKVEPDCSVEFSADACSPLNLQPTTTAGPAEPGAA